MPALALKGQPGEAVPINRTKNLAQREGKVFHMQPQRNLLASIVAAALLAVSGPSQAASTPPSPFNVAITIAAVCSVSTPPNLVVTFDREATVPTEASSPFSVTCTNGVSFLFDLDGQAVASRTNLLAPNTNLLYGLDITNTGGTPVTGGMGTDAATPFNVHLSIPNGQPSGTAGTDVIPHTVAVQF